MRNSIIGGSLQGGSCDWYITSEGGNLDTGGTQYPATRPPARRCLPADTRCFLVGRRQQRLGRGAAPRPLQRHVHRRRDRRQRRPDADPRASTTAAWPSTPASRPCPETDQRGIAAPAERQVRHRRLRVRRPAAAADDTPPDTEYVSGPIQDTLGDDGVPLHRQRQPDRHDEDLHFECRLLEIELTEEPEPHRSLGSDPAGAAVGRLHEPVAGAADRRRASSRFEVRAIDRAGNIDPTPAIHDHPARTSSRPTRSSSRSRRWSRTAAPRRSPSRASTTVTPPQFMEYECRLDTPRPGPLARVLQPDDLLQPDQRPAHARGARDRRRRRDRRPDAGALHLDRRPGPGGSCDPANITLTAVADGWVDEVNPIENYLFETELGVALGRDRRPDGRAAGADRRPERPHPLPLRPAHRRAGLRARVGDAAPLQRRRRPRRAARSWPRRSPGPGKESTLTWFNQPGTATGARRSARVPPPPRATWSGTSSTTSRRCSTTGVNHGWQIRDAHESDLETAATRASSAARCPRTRRRADSLPLLVLRYADDDPRLRRRRPSRRARRSRAHCGQVITESTLVANDLTDCLGEGLVIGAPNIVLDLNGHTISSDALFDRGPGGRAHRRHPQQRHSERRHPQRHDQGLRLRRACSTGGTTLNVVARPDGSRVTSLAGIELFDADDGRNGNTIRNNVFTSNGEAALSLVNDTENTLVKDNEFFSQRRRRLPADRGRRQPHRGQRDHRRVLQPATRQRRRREPRGLDRQRVRRQLLQRHRRRRHRHHRELAPQPGRGQRDGPQRRRRRLHPGLGRQRR